VLQGQARSSAETRARFNTAPMIVLAKCIARCFLVGGAAALAGCAAYERLPLDKESSLAASASELEGAGAKRITLAALGSLKRGNPSSI
jgi:hypothetical protein